MTVRAAALQIGSVPGDAEATLDKACTWIDRAAEQNIELLVFPEWYYPGLQIYVEAKTKTDRYEHCMGIFKAQLDEIPGHATHRIGAKAREHGMHIVFAMIELRADGRMANASVLFSNEGKILNVHRKTVLTPGYETPELVAGDELNVTSTPLGNLGQLICADASLIETPGTLLDPNAQISSLAIIARFRSLGASGQPS